MRGEVSSICSETRHEKLKAAIKDRQGLDPDVIYRGA